MKINMHLPLTHERCKIAFAKRRNDYKTLGNHVTRHQHGDRFYVKHWSTRVVECGVDDTLTLHGADISMTTRGLLCNLSGLRLFVDSRLGALDASVFVRHQGYIIAFRDGMQVRHGVILNPEKGTYHIERCDRMVLAEFQRRFKDDILKAKALDRLEGTITKAEDTEDTTHHIRFFGLDRFRNNWMRANEGYKAVLIDPLKEI